MGEDCVCGVGEYLLLLCCCNRGIIIGGGGCGGYPPLNPILFGGADNTGGEGVNKVPFFFPLFTLGIPIILPPINPPTPRPEAGETETNAATADILFTSLSSSSSKYSSMVVWLEANTAFNSSSSSSSCDTTYLVISSKMEK